MNLHSKVERLFNNLPTLVSRVDHTQTCATLKPYIEQREAPMNWSWWDATLIRPEHLEPPLPSWNFQVNKGWNLLIEGCIRDRFYHIFQGILVYESPFFLSAIQWEAGGYCYPVEDCEVYHTGQYPYYVPFSTTMIFPPENPCRFKAYIQEREDVARNIARIIRIIPIAVTIAPSSRLLIDPMQSTPIQTISIPPPSEPQGSDGRVRGFLETI